MRAFQLTGDDLANLQPVELAMPEPGPGQVLVRLGASSLNYRDLAIARRQYLPQLPRPLVPLSDAAGEVAALGEGIDQWRVGDRVTSHYTPAWQSGRFLANYVDSRPGGPRDGLLREYAVLDQHAVVATPAHLSDAEAATLPIAALTAWNVMETFAPRPGEIVLLQGSGGVALFALQFARLRGAEVWMTTGSPEKTERLRELGASRVFDGREDWGAKVFQASGGGVDLVLELGGSSSLQQSLQAIRPQGGVAVIGFLGGFGASTELVLPMLAKHARVQALSVGHRESFLAMNRAIVQHHLKPLIDSRYAFDQAPAAYERMATGRPFGKLVIEHS